MTDSSNTVTTVTPTVENIETSRRNFLKFGASGAAAVSLSGVLPGIVTQTVAQLPGLPITKEKVMA